MFLSDLSAVNYPSLSSIYPSSLSHLLILYSSFSSFHTSSLSIIFRFPSFPSINSCPLSNLSSINPSTHPSTLFILLIYQSFSSIHPTFHSSIFCFTLTICCYDCFRHPIIIDPIVSVYIHHGLCF